MTAVQLREWETRTPSLGNDLYQKSFAADPTSRQLADQLTKTGRIEIFELAQGLELRATSFVGRFLLGGLTITIHPKIADAPLLTLFRYAYGLRNLDLYQPVDFTSSHGAFQDLLIQQLAAEAAELFERGIQREYECTLDDLTTPRGRIDFTRFARVADRGRTTLPCVFYPRSENTLINRVLLSGLYLAAHLATDRELRAHVKRIAKVLSESVASDRLDAAILAKAFREIDRRTTTYGSALALIEILLMGEGVSFNDEGPRVRLPGFLFDINRFFQALMSRFLREHLGDLEVRDEFRLKGMFSYVSGQNPLARKDPALRPDFMITKHRKTLAVLDAKYRDLWEQSLPREMLYQLSLYALGKVEGERQSIILYPAANTSARDQVIAIREPIEGLSQARVTLRPVDIW